MLPLADKKKARGHKGTYCQRLARHLERLDKNPSVWIKDLPVHIPPILKIPPELLQNILYHVLDDDEMRIARPNSSTTALALVCRQFREDLSPVYRMWDARAAETNDLFGAERVVTEALIKDMMGPLEAARGFSSLRRARATRAGQHNRREKKRPTGLLNLREEARPRHGSSKAASKEDITEMKRWRRARILADGRHRAKLDIPLSATRVGAAGL